MDISIVTEISKGLRDLIHTSDSLNLPLDNNRIANIKKELLLISKEMDKTYPFISKSIQEACRVLFYQKNGYSDPPQYYLNPCASGKVLCLLDLVIDTEQNPGNYIWGLIHPMISKSSKSLFLSGHYANAAEDAYIEINARVKKLFQKIKPSDKVPDGDTAMKTVFSANAPLIKFCDQSTETGFNTQKGYMEMLAGAMSALRNPKAHSNDVIISKEEAMRRLMFASMLMYKIDEGVQYSQIGE